MHFGQEHLKNGLDLKPHVARNYLERILQGTIWGSLLQGSSLCGGDKPGRWQMRRLPCVGTLWRMAEEAILVLREDLGLNRQGPALHKPLSRSVGLQLSRGPSPGQPGASLVSTQKPFLSLEYQVEFTEYYVTFDVQENEEQLT